LRLKSLFVDVPDMTMIRKYRESVSMDTAKVLKKTLVTVPTVVLLFSYSRDIAPWNN
jgi:hypothetical protein